MALWPPPLLISPSALFLRGWLCLLPLLIVVWPRVHVRRAAAEARTSLVHFRLRRVDHGIIEVTLFVFGVTHPTAATCALCTTIAQTNIVLLAAQ